LIAKLRIAAALSLALTPASADWLYEPGHGLNGLTGITGITEPGNIPAVVPGPPCASVCLVLRII